MPSENFCIMFLRSLLEILLAASFASVCLLPNLFGTAVLKFSFVEALVVASVHSLKLVYMGSKA